MKKLNLWLLLSLFIGAFTLVSCGDDDEEDDNGNQNAPGNANDLIGTWSYEGETYVFTKDKLTVKFENELLSQGSYTYNNGILNYTYLEDGQQVNSTAAVKLLYNKTVLVLKDVPGNGEDNFVSEFAAVLFKDGKAPNTPSSDIQGTWYWYMGSDKSYIRAGVMITGNNIEIIITPWSERHVGTFTYSGGVTHLNMTAFYSGRGEHGYGDGEGAINPATLECSNWIPCTYEDIGHHISKDMLFIADGTEAYGFIAGLPGIFVKKK